MSLVRAVHFSSGHSYINPELSIEENRKAYGSLYKESGMGHNFRLEASVTGPVDPESGMILNLVELDLLLKDLVRPLDHHYLNDDVEFFKTNPPTAENIARYCFEELQVKMRARAPGVRLQKVRLHEGNRLWVDYSDQPLFIE
jgi:6-pyruvoyltetrahydropterin/6-carboxytetrahydropterin synthase